MVEGQVCFGWDEMGLWCEYREGRAHEMMSAVPETRGEGIFSRKHNGWRNVHSGKSGRIVLNDYMHQSMRGTRSQREAASALERRHSRCTSMMKRTV